MSGLFDAGVPQSRCWRGIRRLHGCPRFEFGLVCGGLSLTFGDGLFRGNRLFRREPVILTGPYWVSVLAESNRKTTTYRAITTRQSPGFGRRLSLEFIHRFLSGFFVSILGVFILYLAIKGTEAIGRLAEWSLRNPVVAIATLAVLYSSIAFISALYLISHRYRTLIQEQLNSQAEVAEVSRQFQTLSAPRSLQWAIDKVYDDLAQAGPSFEEILRDVRGSVDIVGASFGAILWAPDIADEIRMALERGVRVRVLVLSPHSRMVASIAWLESRSSNALSKEIDLVIRRWQDIAASAGTRSSVEIRTYDAAPSPFMMVADAACILVPYIHSDYLIAVPCFVIKGSDNAMYRACRQHFDNLWRTAVTTEAALE